MSFVLLVLLALLICWTVGSVLAIALCLAARQGDAALGDGGSYMPFRASMYGIVRSMILRSVQRDQLAT